MRFLLTISRFWRIFLIFLGVVCLVLLIGLHQMPSIAQQITQAMIVEVLGGDQVYIQNRKAYKGNVASLGQQVRTGGSRAGLRFNTGAVGRLGANAALTVGRQCFRLQGGQIVVGGQASGCTGSIRAGVRGTIYILEVNEQDWAQLKVLEGVVEIFKLDNPDAEPVVVSAGQKVTISPSGEVSAIEQISSAELNEILRGQLFEGFEVPLPNQDKLPRLRPREGFRSSFLREALTGAESEFDGQKGEPSVGIINPQSEPGIFTRTGTNTAIFETSSDSQIPITLDFDNKTITINGDAGVDNSLGLSGNNATGTVINSDGSVTRIEVFGLEGEEPPVGSSFPGNLTTGIAPDR